MNEQTIQNLKHTAEVIAEAASVLEAAAKGRGNPIQMRRTAEELKAIELLLNEVLNES
jgi:hypothetical protein